MSIRRESRHAFIASSIGASTAILIPRRSPAQSGVVRILTTAVAVGALPLYARDKGFFEAAGLAVEVSNNMSSGAAALAAVAGGAVDIGLSNAGSVAAGVLHGLPFTIIADGALYDRRQPTTFLCAAPNSPISKAADLNGKTIAVNGLKQALQAETQQWIDKNGGKSETVRFVEMPVSAMAPAIESGRIDAASISEPAATMAKEKVKVIGTPLDAVAPLFSQISCVSNRRWVEANKDRVQRFRSAMERAAQWANDNAHEAEALLAGYMHISPAIAFSMSPNHYPTTLEASNLQPAINLMAKYGFISKRIDVSSIITSF